MLRGVNKSIIEVLETENQYFEKAILFIRPGHRWGRGRAENKSPRVSLWHQLQARCSPAEEAAGVLCAEAGFRSCPGGDCCRHFFKNVENCFSKGKNVVQ